jgi:GT2 family glycosyltransferase
MRVCIIIPAHNEEANIGACLHRLLINRASEIEIVVVDDASSDRTGELARSFAIDGRVRIQENRERLGQAVCCNRAAADSKADIFFFLGGDCLPCGDWVEQGLRAFQTNVCAVEGAVRYAVEVPTIRHRVPVNPFYNLETHGSLTVPGRDYASGNFAVRREPFLELGGFNAGRYVLGREDTDLGHRLLKRGEIRFCAAMEVVHEVELWTLRDLLANARRYADDVRFFKDHGDFPFRKGIVLHPRLLLWTLCPAAIPFQLPLKSLRDVAFLPYLYLYLVASRIVMMRTAIEEGVLAL